MALITLPNQIQNTKLSSHTELNENFTAIKTEVDNNLDEENWSRSADLVMATLTVDEIVCDGINITELLTIKLPSADGSHSVTFKDYQGNIVLKISSDGEITI